MTVHNIHDSGYKKVFANRTFFRQLLETFVNEPWVAELDFSTAETVDKSFIAISKLRKTSLVRNVC